MDSSRSREDAPMGMVRAVRTARDLVRLADRIVPAYLRGNASLEGYVKVAHDVHDGVSLAPERTKQRTAGLSVASLEPIVQALDTAYGTGTLVAGRVRDDRVVLNFQALGATSSEPGRRRALNSAGALDRGGILAVLALDSQGAPLEWAGTTQPDGRTVVDVARALDRLRRELDTAAFDIELTTTAGGAVLRAGAEATVVVVMEPGVVLGRVLSLVPDPAMLGRARSDAGAADFSRFVAAAKASGTSLENDAAGTKRPSGKRSGLNGHHETTNGMTPRFDVVRWALGRWNIPTKVTFGQSHRQGSPVVGSAREGARVAVSPIDRIEVEDVTTKLLRAAEEYVGPRLLDRLIADMSPRSWAWQNRRVVVRSPSDLVASTDAEHVYREVRGVFGRGASISNALRDFNFEAWLTDISPGLAVPHQSAARVAWSHETSKASA